MTELEKIFNENTDRLVTKWKHYFEVYEQHFERFRGKEVTILEIGIFHGGSLQMWKKYFGPQAKIYGVDINPMCKNLEEDNIKVFIGSQSDRNFLQKLKSEIPKVDILIDDGGHTMKQQIVTFEELYDHVKENGVYLCEDLHTSYWNSYGGGKKRKGSFIEYSKNLIDQLNAWYSQQGSLKVNEFTRTSKSMHFYDSILVIEKGKVIQPSEVSTGKESYNNPAYKNPSSGRKILFSIRNTLNKILGALRLPAIGFK